MKISFVIPAYNEERLLPRCLQAILGDTSIREHEREVIVVNNASTDKTKEIAASFPSVRVVDEPRKGLSQARHTGFLHARGELIANIDADTHLPTEWIAKVLDVFEKNPRLVALSGPVIYDGISSIVHHCIRLYYRCGFALIGLLRFCGKSVSMIQGGNFVVRRSALETIGGYNITLDFYGEDTDIACRLSAVGDILFDMDFSMPSSARRFHKEGLIMTAFRYSLNFFSIVFFRRPATKKFLDVRE